jgi:hypothetical protein
MRGALAEDAPSRQSYPFLPLAGEEFVAGEALALRARHFLFGQKLPPQAIAM